MLRRPRNELPTEASVVIIGGGVIGTSIAFHLGEAGVSDVLLLERGELASGSTLRAAGGVRAQFSDSLNIQIARRSLEAFGDFGRRPGWEIDFARVGYLFVLTREKDVEAFARNVEVQNGYAVPSRMLDGGEAVELCPVLRRDGILAAAFSPDDGHATPEAVVQGYASGARASGVRIRTHCEVRDIEARAGEVTRVITTEGSVRTGTVICAAGPWSAQIGDLVGIDLPVEPLRRQVLFTEPIPGLPRELPMTIDFESTFYFHREGPGVLMGMSYAGEEPGFHTESTDDWIPDLLAAAERRTPRIARAGIKGGWAGLYEVTPDHNAIIGEAPAPSRFLYATGFSGHGFLQAPAVGEIIRDLFVGEEPFVDIAPLDASRFSNDRLRPELNVI